MSSETDEIWKVMIGKKAQKRLQKMPVSEQRKFGALVKDLVLSGPHQFQWPNYSKLGDEKYHCHLSYSWVACSKVLDRKIRLMDIYYVGSREDAPYG